MNEVALGNGYVVEFSSLGKYHFKRFYTDKEGKKRIYRFSFDLESSNNLFGVLSNLEEVRTEILAAKEKETDVDREGEKNTPNQETVSLEQYFGDSIEMD